MGNIRIPRRLPDMALSSELSEEAVKAIMRHACPCFRCESAPIMRKEGAFRLFCGRCHDTQHDAEKNDEIATHGFLSLAIDEWNRIQELAASNG